MASTDATPFPMKNVAYRVTFPILDADGDLVTGATSPDSEVSKDGGAFADCTNEATEIATSSGMYYLDLTSTEMNADTVAIIVKSGNGKTTPIVLYPQEAGNIKVDVTYWSGTAVATPTTGGVPEVDITHIAGAAVSTSSAQLGVNAVQAGGTAWGSGAITAGAIAADALTAAKIAADVTTEFQNGLATAAALATVDDFLDTEVAAILAAVDTEVAAIKAVTDTLTLSAIADALWDEVLEGTLDGREIMRIILAVTAGQSTGGGTSTITFRDVADAKARVSATIDGSRNRTAVTLDGS